MNLKFIYLFLSIFTLFNFSYALVPVTNCGIFSSVGEYYNLTQDIYNDSTCIQITSNNITFNCNNFIIDGNSTGDVGFELLGENTTILNCNVQKFITGFEAISSDQHRIENTNSNNNSLAGFNIQGDFNNLFNVSVNSNDGEGFYFSGENNKINNISANNNSATGFYLQGTDNQATNLNLYNNNYGIQIRGDNNYLENILSYNNTNGAYIVSASNITLNNSIFYNNVDSNLRYYSANTNDCRSNLINVTGDSKPILFYNSTITISNWNNNISQLILCNADSSIISDLTIISQIAGSGNLIQTFLLDNSVFDNIILRNGRQGLAVFNGNNNTLINSLIQGNRDEGIYSLNGFTSTYLNNTFNNNLNFNSFDFTPSHIFSTSNSANIWLNYTSEEGDSYNCVDLDEDNFCDNTITVNGQLISIKLFTPSTSTVSSLFSYGSFLLPFLLLFFFFLF
jgi:hypothetical protein